MVFLADAPVDDTGLRTQIDAWLRFYYIKKGCDVRAWTGAEWEQKRPEANAALFHHLYENLDSLDAKTSVLIASTSIFTAILAFLLSEGGAFASEINILLTVFAFVSLLSVVLAILVV